MDDKVRKEPADAARGGSAAALAPPPSRRLIRLALFTLVGPAMAVALGLYIYLAGGRFVSTDNAYVKAAKIAVSADVAGRVAKVDAHENAMVQAGTRLFDIDRKPFEIALAKAEAQLASARQEVSALRGIYKQKAAALALAKGDVAFFEQQFERQKQLNTKGVAAQTSFDTAEKALRNARDQVSIILQEMSQASARLGGDPDLPTEQQSSVLAAQAAVDEAKLNLQRTHVDAAVTGVVTNFDLQPGEYVKAGEVVFSLVATDDVWVHANFRETDLTNVKVGQSATVHVDAFPDRDRIAVVESISPATGAEFALLPPQNATGNWVKVVQRLTVRLKLADPLEQPRLRPGMSVIVEIDTQHRRSLSGLLSGVRRWLELAL